MEQAEPLVPGQRVNGGALYRVHVEGDDAHVRAVTRYLADLGWEVLAVGPHPERTGVRTLVLRPEQWREALLDEARRGSAPRPRGPLGIYAPDASP